MSSDDRKTSIHVGDNSPVAVLTVSPVDRGPNVGRIFDIKSCHGPGKLAAGIGLNRSPGLMEDDILNVNLRDFGLWTIDRLNLHRRVGNGIQVAPDSQGALQVSI